MSSAAAKADTGSCAVRSPLQRRSSADLFVRWRRHVGNSRWRWPRFLPGPTGLTREVGLLSDVGSARRAGGDGRIPQAQFAPSEIGSLGSQRLQRRLSGGQAIERPTRMPAFAERGACVTASLHPPFDRVRQHPLQTLRPTGLRTSSSMPTENCGKPIAFPRLRLEREI